MSHLYSDASIGNNIKIWLVKLVDLGQHATVKNIFKENKIEFYYLFIY